jgi:16S rRNA processing protein RimM
MDYIAIGVIVKPQGIKGEVKIKPQTGDITLFESLDDVYIKEKDVFNLYHILNRRIDNESAYLMLEGISDRNQAEDKRNTVLYVQKQDLPLSENTYYICDLIGMDVVDETGKRLGILDDVIETGAVDVYSVKDADKGFMFPALKRVIISVDEQQKTMVLDTVKLAEVAVYEV